MGVVYIEREISGNGLCLRYYNHFRSDIYLVFIEDGCLRFIIFYQLFVSLHDFLLENGNPPKKNITTKKYKFKQLWPQQYF